MNYNFRNIVALLYAYLLIFFGFVRRARKKAMKGDFILSIYFHKPSKVEFENILRWLIKKGFSFLDIETLKMILEGKCPIPNGAVLITVDDGWQSNLQNIVEVANEYKIPVTIFIATQPVEEGTFWWSFVKTAKRMKMKYPSSEALKKVPNGDRLDIVKEIRKKVKLPRETMTTEQVQKIAKSDFITIGGHTHSHPILPNCSYQHVSDELSLSKDKLESWTGNQIDSFAFPNGSYSSGHPEILKQLGYKIGFSNKAEYLTKDHFVNPYLIPRFGFLDGASLAENICRMTGVWFTHTKSLFKN